jgi:competence protein ComFC
MLSLLYPPHCAACGAETPANIHLCPACEQTIRTIREPYCQQCSDPFEGAITQAFTCSMCQERRFRFQSAISTVCFDGVVREFVHRFKYEGQFYLRHPLADWLVGGLDDPRFLGQTAEALVPVPLHSVRQREREFNQAEVLARLLSQRCGIPVIPCLKRTRYTSTQTRLDRWERMKNLRGAFELRRNARVQGRHLILIDDVFTTGSTVNECASVLRRAGAATVRVMTVARG